jgi:DNA-binding PadR family transcriptional regulator
VISIHIHSKLNIIRFRMQTTRDPRRHLPLRPSAFAVLAALADGPVPGIDVLDAVNATVPGAPLLGPGTLYRLLRELRHDQLIARVDTDSPDERHAHHELTPLGRAVLRAEAARLRRTLDLAEGRARGGPHS